MPRSDTAFDRLKGATCGFTLAELLISLAILGVIATFTIPKVLQAQQSQKYNAIAKETVATIASAYQLYLSQNGPNTTMKSFELFPYMNYVLYDTASTIDDLPTRGSMTCDSGANQCVRLHNGAVLMGPWIYFNGSASTNAVYFALDPDGKVTDGTTNGPGKSVGFALYYNGMVRTNGSLFPNTTTNAGIDGPNAALDPPWFSWN